jgi:hypothetical protein
MYLKNWDGRYHPIYGYLRHGDDSDLEKAKSNIMALLETESPGKDLNKVFLEFAGKINDISNQMKIGFIYDCACSIKLHERLETEGGRGLC